MKPEIRKKLINREDDDLLRAITESAAWVLITVANNNDGQSSTLSIRESDKNTVIDFMSILLEQSEIYDLVQKRMADNKLKKKEEQQPPNTTIN